MPVNRNDLAYALARLEYEPPGTFHEQADYIIGVMNFLADARCRADAVIDCRSREAK